MEIELVITMPWKGRKLQKMRANSYYGFLRIMLKDINLIWEIEYCLTAGASGSRYSRAGGLPKLARRGVSGGAEGWESSEKHR